MDDNSVLTLIILVFLVLCSAFFSAAETAFTCLNHVRLKNQINSGNRKAEKVLKLAEDYDKLISSILIGNNLVNILSTSLATLLFVRWFGGSGVTISTIVMTITILLLGEVAPKSIARVMNEKVAFAFMPLLSMLVVIFTPFNFLIGCWQKLIARFVHDDEEKGVTEEEIMTMVEEAENDGEIDEHESELIRSAIEFTDMVAEDILTPRVDVVAIDIETEWEKISKAFADSEFSRLPVYEDEVDNIIGILHEKDFVREGRQKPIRDLLIKPVCVMPSTKLPVLLKLLQGAKAHMAVVSDEYGGVSGIVTLEDILEEIVGEIWDEHDEVIEDFQVLKDGGIRVNCSASIDDFLERFELENTYESATVSGWVLEEIGMFPSQGDEFDRKGLHILIEKCVKHRLISIIVHKNEPQNSEA